MKKLIMCLCFACCCASVMGQQNKKNPRAQAATSRDQKPPKKDISLTNSSSRAALAPASTEQFHISDPTIIALKARAMGADITLGKSGIVGMPKRAYGFANGKILFRSTDATSTGSTTGSGSVGTGSGMGTIGIGGNGIGINGKSPFAAPEIYGIPGTLSPSSPVKEVRKQ